MQVSTTDFIKSPADYLDKAKREAVIIVEDGKEIAILSKFRTPLTDSLVGLIANGDANIRDKNDIRKLRLGI